MADRMRRGARPLIGLLAGFLLASACTTVVPGAAAPSPGVTRPADPPTSSSPAPPSTSPSPSSPPPTPTTRSTPTSTTPSTSRTTATTPTTSSATLADLRQVNDVVADGALYDMSATLQSGNQGGFLQHFDAGMRGRELSWFTNTRAVGVAAARIVRMRGYYSDYPDKATTFSRSVVVGVRTPYDDDDSMPGITYSATFTRRGIGWQITTWKASYAQDPMDCSCTLDVAKSGTVAVVSQQHDDLAGWGDIAVQKTLEGVAWTRTRLAGTGLTAPKGQVVFLADAPFHWFQSPKRPAQTSNVTAPLIDGSGQDPGERYSPMSRIVVILYDTSGSVVAPDTRGILYLWDVVTHEAVHQLMDDNSRLDYSVTDAIDTWVVEGIAAAVETLHRRAHPETADAGYPLDDDPANVDPDWLRDHVTAALPTRDQLYESSVQDRANWYAVAASVYLYLNATYGFTAMMTVARQVYAKNQQTPFLFFPDPHKPGAFLSDATARKNWLTWFTATYES